MGKKRKAAAKPAPEIPERAKNHRTSKDPWEKSREEEYEVVSVSAKEYRAGLPFYLVEWNGDYDDTWEPEANLVNAVNSVKKFNDALKVASDLAKQEKIKLREQKKVRVCMPLCVTTMNNDVGLLIEWCSQAEAAAKKAAEDVAAAAAVDEAIIAGAAAEAAGAAAVQDNAAAQGTQGMAMVDGRMVLWCHRKKKGKLWHCFDLTNDKPTCSLPSSSGVGLCGVEPSLKSGTSNGWDHLYRHHRPVWLRLKKELGQLTGVGDAELKEIDTAFKARHEAAKTEASLPPLPAEIKSLLDSLASQWVVDTDQYFNAMEHPSFKKLQSTATSGAWCGCASRTVAGHVTSMADEGRSDCRDFVGRLQADGRKPVALADLWSKNGVALLGSLMHGMERPGNRQPWFLDEKLASAKPCSKDRHTGDFVEQASFEEWKKVGVEDPPFHLFAGKTDRGSNMIKGYSTIRLSPCVEHVYQRHARVFADHEGIAPTLKMGRAMVGALNHSTIGNVDYQSCRKECGKQPKKLTQECVTRWRSTHGMCDSLREGQTPMLIYDATFEKKPDGLTNNMYRTENWAVNNQSTAQLASLASASKVLEATKGYPTSNLVLPYTYGVMATLAVDVDIVQFWDGDKLQYSDLRSEVKAARAAMLEDMEEYWLSLPEHELRLYQTCSFFDPRLKRFDFPLVGDEWKKEAIAAIKTDYEMNWAPAADDNADRENLTPSTPCEEPAKETTQPPPSMGSFTDFMATVSHLTIRNQPTPDDGSNVEEEVIVPKICEFELYLKEAPGYENRYIRMVG